MLSCLRLAMQPWKSRKRLQGMAQAVAVLVVLGYGMFFLYDSVINAPNAPDLTPQEIDQLLLPIQDKRAPHLQQYALTDDELETVRRRNSHPKHIAALRRRADSRYYCMANNVVARLDGRRHGDCRYFRGGISPAKRKELLRNMLEVLSDLLGRHSIPYWLCSGALVGYHWCGDILPWDDDLDLQMYASDVNKLELLDLKMREYARENQVDLRYIMEVNPYHVMRDELQHNNHMDARFIDVKNGMLIDFMAVRPVPGSNGAKWQTKFDQPHLHPVPPHFETLSDDALFPLQPCKLGRVATFCPHNVSKHLMEDYGISVLRSTHARQYGFRYDETSRTFIKISDS